MSFVFFTDKQKEQARQTDIVSLLESQGETVKRSGKEFVWKNGTQRVTVRGSLWFHQYDRVGGDAIDFVRRFYNKSYTQAVEYLLGGSGGTLIASPPIIKEVKPFELPPKNENNSRVKAYLLHTRGIDKDVYDTFESKDLIYESADYHNAVFVGLDKDGIPRHAHKRGSGSQSTYKGNAPNSQPEYSFQRQDTNGNESGGTESQEENYVKEQSSASKKKSGTRINSAPPNRRIQESKPNSSEVNQNGQT